MATELNNMSAMLEIKPNGYGDTSLVTFWTLDLQK